MAWGLLCLRVRLFPEERAPDDNTLMVYHYTMLCFSSPVGLIWSVICFKAMKQNGRNSGSIIRRPGTSSDDSGKAFKPPWASAFNLTIRGVGF